MVIAFALVGGISGFLSAVVALLLGHGIWQALLIYWLVGTLAAISLLLCHMMRRALCRVTPVAHETSEPAPHPNRQI